MTWDDHRFVWQREHAIVQRSDDLIEGAAGQVSSSNAARKQSVAGYELLLHREVDTDTSFRMTRRVHCDCLELPALNRIMIPDTLIDFDSAGRFRSNPGCLHIQHLQQRVIVLVEQNRGARGLLQLHCPADVVDVRMSDDDLLELELVLIEDGEDPLNLVAGIDHKRFACALVTDHRAVTAEKANGENLVDQGLYLRTVLTPILTA